MAKPAQTPPTQASFIGRVERICWLSIGYNFATPRVALAHFKIQFLRSRVPSGSSLILIRVAEDLNGYVNYPSVYRPIDNKVLGGVCAGLAGRFGIDANLVRIIAVVLSFFGGIGIAGYLTGLAVIPRQGTTGAPISRTLGFTRTWSFPMLTGITFAVLIVLFGIINGSFGVGLLPIAFVAALIYLFSKKQKNGPVNPPIQQTGFQQAADAWQQRIAEHEATALKPNPSNIPNYENPTYEQLAERWNQKMIDYQTTDAYLEPTFENPPFAVAPQPVTLEVPAKVEKKRPGWILAGGLSAIGIAALVLLAYLDPYISSFIDEYFHRGGYWFEPPAVAYAGVITLSLGAALLWTARYQRPKGMLAAAVAMICLTGVLAVTEIRHFDGSTPAMPAAAPPLPLVGPVTQEFTTQDSLPAELETFADSTTYDFSKLALDSDAVLKISATAGEITLLLPENVRCILNWKVKAGEFQAHKSSGEEIAKQSGLSIGGSLEGNAESPALTINAELQAGSLRVIQP